MVWWGGSGLAGTSAVAVPLYTLTSRRVAQGVGRGVPLGRGSIEGYIKMVRCPRGVAEDGVRDKYYPLQLDAFHTMWGAYRDPDKATRSQGAPKRGEQEVESPEEALLQFPIGTVVGCRFADSGENPKIFRGKVSDFSDPYWRMEYPDGY